MTEKRITEEVLYEEFKEELFEDWKDERGRRFKIEKTILMCELKESLEMLLKVRKSLEASLLRHVITKNEEALHEKPKPKGREFKLRKYEGKADYSVLKILNNLEQAVQDVLQKQEGPVEMKKDDKATQEPSDFSIEDTERKIVEVDDILSQIDKELKTLEDEGYEYGKCCEEMLMTLEDRSLLLDAYGAGDIHKLVSIDGEDTLQLLESAFAACCAGSEIMRYCFCKEVNTKRSKAKYLLGESAPTGVSKRVEDEEPPILDPVKFFNVNVEQSLERPEIMNVPEMHEMREQCLTLEDIRKRFDEVVKKEELKSEEKRARMEVKRRLRTKQLVDSSGGLALGNEGQSGDTNRTLKPHEFKLLRSTQIIVQTDKFLAALEESRDKLNACNNMLLRCLNVANEKAKTERRYLKTHKAKRKN